MDLAKVSLSACSAAPATTRSQRAAVREADDQGGKPNDEERHGSADVPIVNPQVRSHRTDEVDDDADGRGDA